MFMPLADGCGDGRLNGRALPLAISFGTVASHFSYAVLPSDCTLVMAFSSCTVDQSAMGWGTQFPTALYPSSESGASH